MVSTPQPSFDVANNADKTGAERMTVRQMPFLFRQTTDQSSLADSVKPTVEAATSDTAKMKIGHWNTAKPEYSHIVNAGSIAMPYLEPYLIRTMRKAKPMISDPNLQAELDLYIKQEATHYKQHRKFNDTLKEAGYEVVCSLEETLLADYSKFENNRSLKFNLAYAEGFESMALAIGQMLIEDREYLFGESDAGVASLVLWHFVEEIEHKNVTFDVLEHIYGSYFWRMLGLVCATGHISFRIGQGYRALLREDGLWSQRGSRWKMAKLLCRLLGNIAPKWFRIWKPGYHPSKIADPSWGKEWAKMFESDASSVAKLDTSQLAAASPVAG
jgi:predicted metal-dependent hydrolase